MKPINIFYEELECDRWLPLDRYPRRIIRRLVRGKPRPSGQMRVFLNLCAGLERIGIPYRINNYRHIQQHPQEVACIVGKPHILDKIKWKNSILFGAAVFSHPCNDSELLNRLLISKILVPGEWMRKMWSPYYGDKVIAWPVGIDTDKWTPFSQIDRKDIDILLYDKVRWEHDRYEDALIAPIRSYLERQGLKIAVIRYGFYREEDFKLSWVGAKQ